MEQPVDWWKYRVWLHTRASRLGPGKRMEEWRKQEFRVSPGVPGLYWRDPLTRTRFFLTRERTEEITRQGLKRIADSLTALGELRIYLQGLSVTADLAGEPNAEAALQALLLPELPDLPYGWTDGTEPAREVAAWRLGDTVLTRVALYNALTNGRLAQPGQEILHRRLLMAGMDRYLHTDVPWVPELQSDPDFALAQRLAFPSGPQVGGAPPHENRSLGFVMGGSVKLKEYLFESARLPAIRGGSVLLDRINRERIPNGFAGAAGITGLIPESLLMAGGGNVLAIVPPEAAEETARFIEMVHERVTVVAQAVAAWRVATVEALLEHDGWAAAVRAELNGLLGRRQGVKLPVWLPAFDHGGSTEGFDINYSALPEARLEVDQGQPTTDRLQTCDACRLRVAEFKGRGPESIALCRPCHHRREAGRSARQGLLAAYEEYAGNRGFSLEGEPPTEISEIAGKAGMFAVLYGDGNNIGSVLQQIQEWPAFRLFAERMQSVTQDAVYGALTHTLGRREVEFLLLGGDDLLLLMPATAAVAVAAELVDGFDLHFRNLSQDRSGPTMSVGVAIGHTKTPVEQLLDAGRQLLKTAKAAARRHQETGTIDVIAMESFSTFSDSVQAFRNAVYTRTLGGERLQLTIRPFTPESARAMIGLIHSLRAMREGGRSLVYGFREASNQMGPDEANLFAGYQVSRLRHQSDDLSHGLERLRCSISGTESSERALPVFWRVKPATLTEEPSWVSPWMDVADLWEYAGEVER